MIRALVLGVCAVLLLSCGRNPHSSGVNPADPEASLSAPSSLGTSGADVIQNGDSSGSKLTLEYDTEVELKIFGDSLSPKTQNQIREESLRDRDGFYVDSSRCSNLDFAGCI